jgi:hypothetical protein
LIQDNHLSEKPLCLITWRITSCSILSKASYQNSYQNSIRIRQAFGWKIFYMNIWFYHISGDCSDKRCMYEFFLS